MKSAKIETMTKHIVDNLLATNINNRNIKKTVVERYERDIRAGHWKLTNQGIGVSSDGILLDGQHRLMALKNAGYPPVECVIVYGLDPESQRVVDQHTKRSARDVFRIAFNATVARCTPAILQVLAKYEPYYSNHRKGTLTMDEMYEMFDLLSDSIDAICSVVISETFFPAPVLAACVHCFQLGKISEEQIGYFLNQVRVGENLTRNMPAFHLRNYLIGSRKSGAGATVQSERYNKTKKALESFIDGKEMGVLRV